MTEAELLPLIDCDEKIKALTLAEYLKIQNDIARAWQSEGEGRHVGLITEDLEHWAEYEITTAWDLAMYLDGECDKIEYD